MYNFTVGPVQEPEYVLKMGSNPTPYFRNDSFSHLMLENEQMIKNLAYAPSSARTLFLTASGTGAMEAAVMNCFTADDRVLVVNGGGFGQRFADICAIHGITYEEIKVPFDEDLTENMLGPYENRGYTGFLVNIHETSVGKLYNLQVISAFCQRNNIFLIVDAISSFLADPFHMEASGVDVMIASSQKALAVPPGISLLVLSSRAINRIQENSVNSMYFDLRKALLDGQRGQTPFTPAVSILVQLHERLEYLCKEGVEEEILRVSSLASYFREKIINLPLEIPRFNLSNAVTPIITPSGMSAYKIFETLERDYGIWICPSGGRLRDKLFRVGHLGDISKQDIDILIENLSIVLG